ncbi:DUF4241 domain-containing protein [Kitasatospora sp. NPDC058046]|uniref:DUF4241 domain-containing protein n=1 Tax=Kitasatospora sp. NPDC058046 TaxID=3346312 RepID=UPI0036D8D93D
MERTLALTDGQAVADLGVTEFFGYGVDAGTGCFVDAAVTIPLGDLLGEDGDLPVDALFGDADSMALSPVVLADPATGHNCVAPPSGWSDGTYPTRAGRSAGGEVTGFVTEFFVVPQPGRGSARFPLNWSSGCSNALRAESPIRSSSTCPERRPDH